MSSSTANAPADEKVLGTENPSTAEGATREHPAIEAEMLIEEISIDGMCGVY